MHADMTWYTIPNHGVLWHHVRAGCPKHTRLSQDNVSIIWAKPMASVTCWLVPMLFQGGLSGEPLSFPRLLSAFSGILPLPLKIQNGAVVVPIEIGNSNVGKPCKRYASCPSAEGVAAFLEHVVIRVGSVWCCASCLGCGCKASPRLRKLFLSLCSLDSQVATCLWVLRIGPFYADGAQSLFFLVALNP